MQTRFVHFRRPDSLMGWVVTLLAVGVVLALVVVFTTIGLVLLAAALVTAPVLAWWRRRRGTPVAPRTDPRGRRVIDVEYEVHERDA